jgi:hypothetical protein
VPTPVLHRQRPFDRFRRFASARRALRYSRCGIMARTCCRTSVRSTACAPGAIKCQASCSARSNHPTCFLRDRSRHSVGVPRWRIEGGYRSARKCVGENRSFAPLGLSVFRFYPRRAPWAAFLRRFAAGCATQNQSFPQPASVVSRKFAE